MMGRVRVAVVTLAAVALTAGPASAQPKAPGVTNTDIVIGLSAPITFGADRHHGLNAVPLMRARKAADLSHAQVAPYQVFKPLF
jgi:hypothetical protein